MNRKVFTIICIIALVILFAISLLVFVPSFTLPVTDSSDIFLTRIINSTVISESSALPNDSSISETISSDDEIYLSLVSSINCTNYRRCLHTFNSNWFPDAANDDVLFRIHYLDNDIFISSSSNHIFINGKIYLLEDIGKLFSSCLDAISVKI